MSTACQPVVSAHRSRGPITASDALRSGQLPCGPAQSGLPGSVLAGTWPWRAADELDQPEHDRKHDRNQQHDQSGRVGPENEDQASDGNAGDSKAQPVAIDPSADPACGDADPLAAAAQRLEGGPERGTSPDRRD